MHDVIRGSGALGLLGSLKAPPKLQSELLLQVVVL
jgi:hypothetical protein